MPGKRGWFVAMPLRVTSASAPSQALLLLQFPRLRRRLLRPASARDRTRSRDNAGWQAGLEDQGSDEGSASVGASEWQTGLLQLPLDVRELHERPRRVT